MRVAAVLLAVSALAGTGLADIKTIRKSMFDVMNKVKAMDQALVAWPGDVVSGSDLLCKTIELRKSLKACTKAFEDSKRLRVQEFTRTSSLPLVRLANTVFDLKDHAVAARPKFDGIGATATIHEVLKAQKDSASELSQTMDKIFSKLPPSFRDSTLPLPSNSGPTKIIDFARTFMNKEFDEMLQAFQPRPDQIAPFTPFIMMGAKFSESIDASPFCQALPPLLTALSAQQSTSLGDLTNKVLKILDSSGVQDQIPLDIISKNAEVFGVPAGTIPNMLKQLGVNAQGLPLRAFTKRAPQILEAFGVQDLQVDPSKIIQFVNLFAKNVLGSEAPPPTPAKVARRRIGMRGGQ